ncbi:MAG TPA: ATP-grasp domain-containing protein [Trebonia sp.]|jgi:biotin carboxylase|nr:ATP-grasp domain-containing protein [Trebonia sp.]
MSTLLMVGVGVFGRPYISAARQLGARVHAVEVPARAQAIADHVDGVTICSGESDEAWAEAAVMAAMACHPSGVVAYSEPHVLGAALVQDEFGLPGPSLRAAVISRNKALQRGRFAAAGIGQPDYLVTSRLSDAADWAGARLPVVVKPLSSAGSAGVELVPDAAAFREVAARRDADGMLLVERAVTGPEYSWEALVRDGKTWYANLTAKETSEPPYFVEVAHRTAPDVSDAVMALADDLGAAVVNAMGMRNGLVHLEFRLTPDGDPAVMEVAVRTPGDGIMDLLALTYDMNWYELAARVALGDELPPPPQGPVRFAASFLPSAQTGTVTAVNGLAEVRAMSCVVDASILVSPGDHVVSARSSADRVGQVVLAAEDRAELEAALADVRRTLVVVTQPN